MIISPWLCLVGSLLELDTTYAFQLTLSRGVIAGPLLGLVAGDVLTGLQVGVFTELLFIDINPLGGLLPPSATVCCAITLALYSLHIPIYFAFFFGVIGAILFSLVEILMRKRRSLWLLRKEPFMLKQPSFITTSLLYMLGASFVMTFLFIVLYSMLVGALLQPIALVLPEKMHIAGRFAYMAVPWIGLATLVSTFRLKTR